MSRYLFIGAHIDDLELSCGGTVIKKIEQGHEVTMITMSHSYNGTDLIHEWHKAQSIIKPASGIYKDFTTRYFRNQRQDIMDYLVKLAKHDFVFTHSPDCFHQDHSILGEEVIRAFKNCSIATFNQEWNIRTQTKNYFEVLEQRHIEKKIQALKCFESQSAKNYISPDFIMASAINNGVACGVKYAEAFNVLNIIQ